VSGSNVGVQICKRYEQRQASAAALSAPPSGRINSIGKGWHGYIDSKDSSEAEGVNYVQLI
jgi:hypothetical protein